MKILVLNSGSSSLKYQLFDINGSNFNVTAKGQAERIGNTGAFVNIKIGEGEKVTKELPLTNHTDAIKEVFSLLLNGALNSMEELSAVGHRVVHGGEYFDKSALVTDEVMAQIEELAALAPLHNPANLMGIKAIKEMLPNVKQVVTFDTAFHQTMPAEAFMYALPLEQYKNHKIRRYGFHGTSHYFVSKECEKLIGTGKKIITCHLGQGASIAAIKDGKCMDTSMGFTPLAGVVMGTRSGDVDPYIPLFIQNSQNKTADDVNTLLNKQSGMLGLTGLADMRDIEDAYLKGEEKAVNAMSVYVYTIVKFVGSYVAALGGVDALVFTAGIGENSGLMRKLILDKLAYLGIKVNEAENNQRGRTLEVSTADSAVKAFAIPTNEELVIAQDTFALIG